MVGTWTVTLTGATLTGTDAGNYNLTSVATTTASISTAFRVIGFFPPVDMTQVGAIHYLNSIKGGQTVPLKFRAYSITPANTLGAEITSTAGISVVVK